MGEVWLCRDEALGVDRAVKFLLAERAGDAALRARFAAEARTLAALGDVPGVVRVHAAGEDPATRRPFFAMDAHLLAPDEVRAVCTRRLGLSSAAAEAVLHAVFAEFESHAESAEAPAPPRLASPVPRLESHAESAETSAPARLASPVPRLESHAESAEAPAPERLASPVPRLESHAESAEIPFTLQDALGDEAAGTARQIPERSVLSLAREIASALARLHGREPPVVHRDIKPSNLLFAADGRLLLADFGVARTLDAARAELTRPGFQPGTQRYAAPELLRGDPATPAADWYALGVVLFRALTSSFPQWGESLPTREGLRPFSPLWEPLLRDLLAPDPARRLADHAAFSRRLDTLEKALDRPREGRRRLVLPAVALAAIALLGAEVAARLASPVARFESHAESAEAPAPARLASPVSRFESHAESAEAPATERLASPVSRLESHAESAEASLGEAGLRLESAESGDDILDAVREFLPAVDRIVEEHGVLLPDWNLPVSQFEANPAAREYRLIMARRALDTAERLRRKAEAGEQLSDSDFSQGIVTRDAWEAWLARRRAKDGSVGPSPGEVRTVMLPGGVPLDLVWVPPGTFAMGLSEKERAPCRTPAGTIPGDDTDCDGLRPRTVTLPRGFWLARTELTQAQWSKIEYGEAGSSTPYSANRPRILSWKMAERTIKNLNRLDTGLSFRFPTEAEWEWAARGGPLGGGHAWSGSDDPADVAWTANSWPPDGGSPYSADFPEVATKRPNELGLFDMAGSYSEWCLDRHDPPDGASRTDYRVLRGGNLFLSAAYCRNGSHDAAPADDATGWTGLRVAADEAP